MTHADRIKAYSTVLERLYRENPVDVELASFYALSLVSLAYVDGDNEMADRQKAIAILGPLLQQHPDHPGVAHYLIHATNRPEFAAQGLDAARRYAAIAPDSAHALHMPSHIFVRLGLWQDSIASNIAANASGAHAAEMHLAEYHYQTHAMDFLSYSYLQSGQEAKAREVMANIARVIGASEENKASNAADHAARIAMELHRWNEAASLAIPAVRPARQDSAYRARVIGKARSGDIAGARADLERLKEIKAAQEKDQKDKGYSASKEKRPDRAEAWLAFAEGKHDEALRDMRAIADHEDAAGVDSLSIPSREMVADMLLELKRPAEALAEYKTALKNSPNDFDDLLGAARPARASGDTNEAQSFYAKLEAICSPGADRPELAEAKTYLAQK